MLVILMLETALWEKSLQKYNEILDKKKTKAPKPATKSDLIPVTITMPGIK